VFIGKYNGLEGIGPSRLRRLHSKLDSIETGYEIKAASDLPETPCVGVLVSERFYGCLSKKLGPVFTAQQAKTYIEQIFEREGKDVKNAYKAPKIDAEGGRIKSMRRERAPRRAGPATVDVSGFGQKYSSFEYLRPVEQFNNDHPPRTILRPIISSQTPSRRESVLKIAEYLAEKKDKAWLLTFPMLLQATYESMGFDIDGFAVDTAPIAEYFSKAGIDIKAWFFKENRGKPSKVKMKNLAEKIEAQIKEKYGAFFKKSNPGGTKRNPWGDLDDLNFGNPIPGI
jgi:hypothetical protein